MLQSLHTCTSTQNWIIKEWKYSKHTHMQSWQGLYCMFPIVLCCHYCVVTALVSKLFQVLFQACQYWLQQRNVKEGEKKKKQQENIKGGEGGACFSFLRLLVTPVRKMDCMQQARHKVSGEFYACLFLEIFLTFLWILFLHSWIYHSNFSSNDSNKVQIGSKWLSKCSISFLPCLRV